MFIVKKILDNVTFYYSRTKEHTSLTTLFFSPYSKTDKRVIKNTFVSIYLFKFATLFATNYYLGEKYTSERGEKERERGERKIGGGGKKGDRFVRCIVAGNETKYEL